METVRAAAGEHDGLWFGIAWAGEYLVATAIGSDADNALRVVLRCLPDGVKPEVVDPPPSSVVPIVDMLAELERGHEENKRFRLSPDFVSGPLRRILTAAAAIPIGYVSTYGNIAAAAGSEARAVGRVMATNPLYPIVPCHRVVGSDMALVGYGGRQDEAALKAKLSRLAAEVRGAPGPAEIPVDDSVLTVYPVERVLEEELSRKERQRLAAERDAARETEEQSQLRLF